MPVKKIFSIEVDDTQFKKFKELFDRYQTAVAKLPQDWQKVAVAAGAVAEAHKRAGVAAEKQAASVKKQATALNSAKKDSDSIFQSWRSIASSARETDRAIERAAVKMTKWAGLAGGVLGGLGAVGVVASLFGLDRLAGSISSGRRQAMGLGISYGENRAYDINYSRLVHPGDIMSNISAAKYDSASDQYKGLLQAGISQEEIRNKDPAQLFSEFMHKLPEMFPGGATGTTGTVLKQTPLGSLISQQDLVSYLNASPNERSKIESDTQKNAKDIDLQDSVQRQWQDFLTQLSRAEETIKSHLMNKLSVIEPGLEDLSKTLTGMVTKFVDSGAAKASINWLGVELNKFADLVGKKEFQDGVRDFAKWVGTAAKKIWEFVSFFGASPAAAAETVPNAGSMDQGDFHVGDIFDPITGKVIRGNVPEGLAGATGSPAPTTAEQKAKRQQLMDYLVGRGWTPSAAAIAAGNAQQESSFNPGKIGDHGTSFGMFQWHADRAGALLDLAKKEGKDWKDFNLQEEFFAHEAESRNPSWKGQQDLSNAGIIGWQYERYGDNSTGARVANSHAALDAYHPKSVVIRNQSGSNAPRSIFSVAQPYAAATQPQ
jgi:Phage tail lysozyme